MSTRPQLDSIRATMAEALGTARRDFAVALSGQNPIMTFLGTTLRVDRRRGIVATSAEPRDWADDSIDSGTIAGRNFLALFIGPERYIQVREIPHYLAIACRGGSAQSETHAALFTNLLVVEPYWHPEREGAIWLAVAVELAEGHLMTNVFNVLPQLRTERDPVDPSVTDARDAEGEWLRMEGAMVARAVPEAEAVIRSAHSSNELRGAILAFQAATDDFVAEHLVSAVVAELQRDP